MYFKVRKHHSAYLLLQRIREGIKAKPARNGSVQPQYSLWIMWILILQDSQETAFISVKLNPISLCLQVRYSQHMNPSFTQMKLSKNPSANSCHPLPTEPGMIPSLKDRNIFHSNSERACTQSDNTRLMAREGQKGLHVPIFQGALWGRKSWHQSWFSKWNSNIHFLPVKATGLSCPLAAECLENIKPAQPPPIHELVPLE